MKRIANELRYSWGFVVFMLFVASIFAPVSWLASVLIIGCMVFCEGIMVSMQPKPVKVIPQLKEEHYDPVGTQEQARISRQDRKYAPEQCIPQAHYDQTTF